MGVKLVVAGVCGAVFGYVNGVTIATFTALGLAAGDVEPIDFMITKGITDAFSMVIVPAAVLAGAVFFCLLAAVGFLRVSGALGAAGGAFFGFAVGPPESLLPDMKLLELFVRLPWEWIMGGVGAIVGNLIEKWALGFD